MQEKDFSILCEKIPMSGNKTDIAIVSGYNSVVQKISHLFNTQKGELPSDRYFGSDYFTYLFDPVSNKTTLEGLLGEYIKASVTNVTETIVSMTYYDMTKIKFNIIFSYFDGKVLKKNITCNIEVDY